MEGIRICNEESISAMRNLHLGASAMRKILLAIEERSFGDHVSKLPKNSSGIFLVADSHCECGLLIANADFSLEKCICNEKSAFAMRSPHSQQQKRCCDKFGYIPSFPYLKPYPKYKPYRASFRNRPHRA
jgi:hypothetical protein